MEEGSQNAYIIHATQAKTNPIWVPALDEEELDLGWGFIKLSYLCELAGCVECVGLGWVLDVSVPCSHPLDG
jgi:hypothetical protein